MKIILTVTLATIDFMVVTIPTISSSPQKMDRQSFTLAVLLAPPAVPLKYQGQGPKATKKLPTHPSY